MKGADPQLPDNQWIEIEVYLRTFDRSVTPSISDLTVEYDTSGKESCNGIDDDCDGYIDNMPNTNQPLLQRCKTNCGSGLRICDGGQWKTCNSPSPTKETCNGRDDDCDGDVDEDAKCIDGSTCYGGACTSECKPSCPQGTTCKTIEGKSLCIGDGNCKTLQDDCLKEKKICRNGRCVDPCAGVGRLMWCLMWCTCAQLHLRKTRCSTATRMYISLDVQGSFGMHCKAFD